MRLPKELTTVTALSKAVALIMFISLPIITFLFGMQYQSALMQKIKIPYPIPTIDMNQSPEQIACTMDARICPDGTAVGRIPPNCEFEACPDTSCGGIQGKVCAEGYYCKYEGTHPDASGTCMKDQTAKQFTCPKNEYVDCMPGPDRGISFECTSEFLRWAEENCPNFKGAAY